MKSDAFRLIADDREHEVRATIDSDRVLLGAETVRDLLGWELKPEGLCRGGVCVPLRRESGLVEPAGIDLAGLAAVLDLPLALDVDERIACVGTPAAERSARLQSLEAPDFRLPDLAGELHSLSDYRGRKVLLLAYASW